MRGWPSPGLDGVGLVPAGLLGKDNSFLSCKDRDLAEPHLQACSTSHPGSALLGKGEGGVQDPCACPEARSVLRR